MWISRINAAEVLDSRGNPTVEANVVLEAIAGIVVTEQRRVDQRMLELDGTPNKERVVKFNELLRIEKTTRRAGSLRRQSGVSARSER